jgi:hypothetical protein
MIRRVISYLVLSQANWPRSLGEIIRP